MITDAQPPKRRGRPPKAAKDVASGAERQERHRARQQRATGQAMALIAAMDRMVSDEQRAKLEAIPAFKGLLATVRLTIQGLGGSKS